MSHTIHATPTYAARNDSQDNIELVRFHDAASRYVQGDDAFALRSELYSTIKLHKDKRDQIFDAIVSEYFDQNTNKRAYETTTQR